MLQLFLSLITIGPWVLLVFYDFLLYTYRSLTYEVPGIGGRARGKHRPRAPSLSERPSGAPRRLSLAYPAGNGSPRGPTSSDKAQDDDGSRHRRTVSFQEE